MTTSAVIVCVATALAVFFAIPSLARRAASVTLPQPLADEAVVLAGVWLDPRRLPWLSELTAAMFASAAYGRIWAAMRTAGGAAAALDLSSMSAAAADAACAAAGESLSQDAEQFREAVTALLLPADQQVLLAATETLPAVALSTPEGDPMVTSAATAVLTAGVDRTLYTPAGAVVASDDPDSTDASRPPLRRAVHTWSVPVRAAVAAGFGVGAAFLPAVVSVTGFTGFAAASALVALLVLWATSVAVAIIDVDTLMVDMPIWAVGTGAAWAATAAACVAGHYSGRLLIGLASVVAVAGLFEGVNWLFVKVRGVQGQGFGDTLIVVGTVGVPAALLGSFLTAYYTVMGSLVAAIAAWVVAAAAGKATRARPFALGPWLAVGWLLAGATLVALG